MRLTVESMVRSCTGCIYSEMPATLGGRLLHAPHDLGGIQERSSFGFKLMRKRPLLSVVLMPSTPMNDDRPTTSGSFRMASARALLSLRHRLVRNALGRFGDALDQTGILHRKESLRAR